MPDDNDVQLHVRKVPAGLWRRAKIEAVRRGCTVREVVIDALTDYLRTEED